MKSFEHNDDFFENLLISNRVFFYESRTSLSLKKQYNLLKKLNLLKDQVLNEKYQDLDYELNNKSETNQSKQKNQKCSLIADFKKIESSLDDIKIFENVEIDNKIEEGSILIK